MRGVVLLVAALACGDAIAQGSLSESERRLLQSAISRSSATEMGKAADAAGLERIVALGDPALVQSFDYGMRLARIETMPPEVEAVVVRHFDDARVGAALRAFTPRYRTRALFDLHLARVKAAYRSDEPSFQQVLRTDQAGIEEAVADVAPRFPASAGEMNPAIEWLARRNHPAAIPGLVAAIEPSLADPRGRAYNRPVEALIAYPDPATWRRADAEVERARAAGRALDANYATARRLLDPVVKDPEATIARRQAGDVRSAFMQRTNALVPSNAEIYALRDSDPPRYVRLQRERYVEEEAIARELGFDAVAYTIFANHRNLGLYIRFRMNDPKAALPDLERAASGNDLMGQLALADTYQLDLRDKPNALRALRLARDTAASGKGEYGAVGGASQAFWTAWLDAEIAYVQAGRPFAGRIEEKVVTGFWEAQAQWSRLSAYHFPQWAPPLAAGRAAFAGGGGFAVAAPSAGPAWTGVLATYASIDGPDLARRLAAARPSRLALFATLPAITLLADPRAIVAELARHDPSGYWTTIVLGTVAWHEGADAARRDAALRNGVADALPGMAREPRPNALARASASFLKDRALQPVAKAP